MGFKYKYPKKPSQVAHEDWNAIPREEHEAEAPANEPESKASQPPPPPAQEGFQRLLQFVRKSAQQENLRNNPRAQKAAKAIEAYKKIKAS